MSDSPTTHVQDAINAGTQIAEAAQHATEPKDGIPFFVQRSETGALSLVTMEPMLARPVRRKATVPIRTADSFITYVKRFADANTLVFANLHDRTLTAVIDYHEEVAGGGPRWGQHRAVLTCHLTIDWQTWTGSNKKSMSQEAFAHFLEDNLPLIAQPPGATVLEMARQLEAKKDVNFRSSILLQNGERQFVYEEVITGTSQKGTVMIPESFTLGLRPFEGADVYKVDARFRYKLDNGTLTLRYELVRPEAVLEDAFKIVREKIAAADILVLEASAPAMP